MPTTGPYELKRGAGSTTLPKATVYKQQEWLDEGVKRFGSFGKVKFICPTCKHVQSVESCVAHGDTRDKNDIINSLYQNCEGRFNELHGCHYTLNGLFSFGTTVVESDGPPQMVFDFAPEDAETTSGPRQGMSPEKEYKARLKRWQNEEKTHVE